MFNFLIMALTALRDLGLDALEFLKFLFLVAVFLGFGILFGVVYSAIFNLTTVPAPLQEEPLLRRDRRANAASVRCSSFSSRPPVTLSDFDIKVMARISEYNSAPRSLSSGTSLTMSYPSAIDYTVEKMASCGLQPKFRNGLIVDWEPIAPQGASLVTAEMVATKRPSTPVVAAPADLATDTSPRVGPAKPPQCHFEAAPATDTGRAGVPTPTEGLVSRVVEPLQGDSAASAVDPGLANVQASTDGMARPIAPTWTPSSGPVYLPPRERDPRFTLRNWRPSTGVVYELRQPHPVLAAVFASPAPLPRPLPVVTVSPPSPVVFSSPAPVVFSSPSPKPAPAPAPAPRPLPATPAPAAHISRPPRHTRSLAAAISRPRAPISTPAPTTTAPAPAPIPAPAPAQGQLANQNWMASLSETLALTPQKLGLTEDQLMAWETPSLLPASLLPDAAAEAAAQQDAMTMTQRYGTLARDLKRAAVLLRLQLQRVPAGRYPARNQFHKIFRPLHEAAKAFNVLKTVEGARNAADFGEFKNAVKFFSDHVLTMGEYEECLVHYDGEVKGKGKAVKVKDAAAHVRKFLGIQPPNVLDRLGLA
ncbi:hypothetical protein DPSP01_013023 [Paraphaeosphaeria sporulosa]